MVLKPDGKQIDFKAKQLAYSYKTISTVAVAKAIEILVGLDASGKYSLVVSVVFQKFYVNMKDEKVISDLTYENTSTQVLDGFVLPDIEPEQKVSDMIKDDVNLASEFVDKFI